MTGEDGQHLSVIFKGGILNRQDWALVKRSGLWRRRRRMALNPTATDQRLFRFEQWMLLADYGLVARRNMMVAWTCIVVLALVEIIWLPISGLSFEPATWPELAHSLLYAAAAYIFYL